MKVYSTPFFFRRCPSPGNEDHTLLEDIGHFTLYTVDARSVHSACVHMAIVNISALVVVVFVDHQHSSSALLPWIDIAPTMFGCFCTVYCAV